MQKSSIDTSSEGTERWRNTKRLVEESMMRKTAVLRGLLLKFEETGIEYAMIRNYRFLVENAKCIHRDFDVLITSKDFDKANEVAMSMGFENCTRNDYRKGAVWARYSMDIPGQDRPLLLDLHRDVVREFMIPYMGMASFNRKIRRGGIWTFSDEDTFVNEVVHATITKGFIKKRYRDDITRYLASPEFDRAYACRYLEDLFGDRDAARIMRCLGSGEFDRLLKMRRRLFRKFVTKDRKTFLTYLEFFVKNTARQIVGNMIHPKRARVIALVGVDGSGKSTASENIKDYFETYFGKRCEAVYMGRGRNRALPGARATMGKIGIRLPVADQIHKEGVLSRRLLYLARDITYVVDAFARYFFFIYRRKRRKINVVTDRYAYDIMLNNHTYNATRNFIINFYPRPDVLVYLYNSAGVLYERKLQHGVEKLSADMRILEDVLDDLAGKGVRVVKIKTDSIDDTLEKIYESLK